MPQSCRDNLKLLYLLKLADLPSVFSSEGTSPIFSQRSVRKEVPQKDRSEMKPRILKRVVVEKQRVPSEGH